MKAKGNQTFIEFSANISEILNDRGNPRRPEGYYPWSAWRIEAEILNLLAGRNYCGLAGSPRYADHIVGYHMSGYHDPGYSAEEYFRCVFDHITTNKKKLEDPPTTRLQDYIRSHCLDPDKQHEPNLSPVSLWQIIARAGETEGSAHNPPCYRYFEGEDCHRLKICLYDVLSNSNRLYGELYRLGLYPPQYINDIKPMQARQLNKLIKRARERAGESGKWQQHLPAVWAETPLKK